ncbi:TNFAIP3-interacting protein 2 [Hoplias malabaricus]|uniref:TNFAIP3-interacting protein 2 n=1 Tax=Hoplias malabaricus TaxID=27720 RepID=UPI0034635CD8
MDHIKQKEEDSVNKLRSCSTLNTFYHETQQEIANLGQQLFVKDGIITELKVRLAKYERTCVTEGEEPCVVGPSKSLVDSLCKEICKLKQKLKDSELDSAHKLESSKREIQLLQQKLREKEQELEIIRQRPEHKKEQEIQRLHSVIAERERAQATKDVLCTSLAEEASLLRIQLGTTVQVCQDLLERLKMEKAQDSNKMSDSEVAHLRTKVGKLQEENQHLKERVAYVENLNSKWQKYDSGREEYVRGLCQKLKESNGLSGSGSPLTPATGVGSGALLQQEISRLNKMLNQKMVECERLSRERDDCALRDRERIQMLEQQNQAYIDDFKSERADRERAQGKISDLQDEVGRLQLQIHAQNARESQTSTRRLQISLKKPSRSQTEKAEPLQRNSPPESSTKRAVTQLAIQGSSDVQCPRCLTTYNDKQTDELLNHWDECAKL